MRTATLLLGLTACVSAQQRHASYTPVHGTSVATKDKLYSAALTAVSDTGATIETRDAAAGLIVTEWECSVVMNRCTDRYRLRVSVGDGSYDVAILCSYDEGGGEWSDCTARYKTRPQGFLDKQRAVESALASVQ